MRFLISWRLLATCRTLQIAKLSESSRGRLPTHTTLVITHHKGGFAYILLFSKNRKDTPAMTNINITRTNDKSNITFTDPNTSNSAIVILSTLDIYALIKALDDHLNEDLNHYNFVLNADTIINDIKIDAEYHARCDGNLLHSPYSEEQVAAFEKFLAQDPEDQYELADDKLRYAVYNSGADIDDAICGFTDMARDEALGLEY